MIKTPAVPSGLDYFRGIIAGAIEGPPMGKLLGFKLLEVEPGRVVFAAEATPAHHNTMAIAHGGLAATLLDSALGCAVNTLAPACKVFTTLELHVNYLRPITDDVGPLRCEAKAIHVGGRVATAEARLVDLNGKVYAHGTTTMIVVEPRNL